MSSLTFILIQLYFFLYDELSDCWRYADVCVEYYTCHNVWYFGVYFRTIVIDNVYWTCNIQDSMAKMYDRLKKDVSEGGFAKRLDEHRQTKAGAGEESDDDSEELLGQPQDILRKAILQKVRILVKRDPPPPLALIVLGYFELCVTGGGGGGGGGGAPPCMILGPEGADCCKIWQASQQNVHKEKFQHYFYWKLCVSWIMIQFE